MEKKKLMEALQGGLIVSCQALEEEPLHSSFIMSRMARAAMEGGAQGIRANSTADIAAIKKEVSLPVIGLIKRDYPDSPVYITPTAQEVEQLSQSGTDIIALDFTRRIRPGGIPSDQFFKDIRRRYPNCLFMADCASLEDALLAEQLGFDFAGTTLCGYTDQTRGIPLPAFGLMREMARQLSIPVIAEGGIWTPEQLRQALDTGAFAAVVGTAITRPREITQRFVKALQP